MDPPPTARGTEVARLDPALAPAADDDAVPEGFVVATDDDARIHFHDWGGPADRPGVLLVPGLGRTAWDWAPVARRLVAERRVVVVDPRGHGLSDAPQEGYDAATLAADLAAVAEGAGLGRSPGTVVAGHGFGAVVAAWAAAAAGFGVAALVLVDGGFERREETTGTDLDEALRALEEPPEVMRSMDAYLADRRGWDPATWDADQERATRESVVQTAAGRLVRAVRPHALEASLRALFAFDPVEVLGDLDLPITVLAARDDDEGRRGAELHRLAAARAERHLPPIRLAAYPADGHNLLRYRPAETAVAILTAAEPVPPP